MSPFGVVANTVLANTVLANTVLANTVLANTVLANTVLANTVLANTVLANTVLANTVLVNSLLADAAFLGADLLAWLVLALGAAMVVGNVMALVRPPERPRHGELARPPFARSALYVAIGAVAAVWALATLIGG